ncbi:hypothetical protein ACGF0K_39380 [Streptomyces sp. NPDC048156]|uniref:hypothetical protein n=1 Tax=Streptomyces sp. NPDC048156 TaxID=3365502 RepID=UPI0037135D15
MAEVAEADQAHVGALRQYGAGGDEGPWGWSSPFDPDYLTVEHAEICVGWSRHWVVVWLWFLS